MSGHSPDHRPISEVLYCHCRPGHCDCTDARVAAADMNAVFDLRWKADRRATEAWQAAHPGNDLVWPDHADMVTWLLERDAILRAAAQAVVDAWDDGIDHADDDGFIDPPYWDAMRDTHAALRAALGDEP